MSSPVELHASPPNRPAWFPFVVLEPGESSTLEAGTALRVLGNQEIKHFFAQPDQWLRVAASTGEQGWIDASEGVAWVPLTGDIGDPLFVAILHATAAWVEYVQAIGTSEHSRAAADFVAALDDLQDGTLGEEVADALEAERDE